MSATLDPEVREALEELQQYLSDTLPPLVVAPSLELLTKYPPQLSAHAIQGWTGAQYGRAAEVPVSDFLFHAFKKIHLLGEFRLVPRAPFEEYLRELTPLLLALCPESDRDLLRENLERLKEPAASAAAAAPERLFRQMGPRDSKAAPGGDGRGTAAAGDWKRFSLFLERLEAEARRSSGKPAVSPETLAAAARSSRNAREIETYLERLKDLGIEVGTEDVFRALARSLPSWAPPPSSGAWPEGAGSPAAEAMRRMVVEAEDPLEGARRFGELVRAAIERFNQGSLPQAVSTLELAEKLIAEKKVDPGTVEVARRKGDEQLDGEKLKAFAENPRDHPLLRKVLSFFALLTVEGLLAEVKRENRRDRRRLLLLLLEAHGAAAREAALRELHADFDGAGDEWYYRRNLLYLLRRIPRRAEDPLEEEVRLVVRYAELRFPPPLVREAVASLGQLRHEESERALVRQLGDIEDMLGRPAEALYDPKELKLLLDRVTAALARFGTPAARRAVVEHAGRRDARLGDTMARLAELSTQDLSADPDTVERILGLLRANLPLKVFGLVLHQNDQSLQHAIAALASTPTPAVRRALEDIVERFRDQEFGRAAAKTLAGLAAPPPAREDPVPAASLSGDLEVFGLPALLQSLSDSALSGALALKQPNGELFGTLTLAEGKLAACRTGALEKEDAFYQLLERPRPGSFHFTKAAARPAPEMPPREVLPLVLEAMRRYDELQGAAALVPDDARWTPGDARPTPHPGEKDGLFVKALWEAVSQGRTARECEGELRADSYRIRRVLAHWVEQGALKLSEAPSSRLPASSQIRG